MPHLDAPDAPGRPLNGSARPPRQGLSHQPWTVRLRPRLSTVLIALLAAQIVQRRARVIRPWQWAAFVLGITNWRVVPLYWTLWVWLPIIEAWRRDFRYWRLGPAAWQHVIATSPFDAVSRTRHVASWNACDFLMHLSNSSYACALDQARLRWHLRYVGLAMRNDREGVRWAVASTHFTFFQEVPLLARYEVDVRPVAWDHKWVYLCSTFTTAPPQGSAERVVNCISVSRTVLKLGRRTVPPARLFALAGFGPDRTNWERAESLRAQAGQGRHRGAAGREWLVSEGDDVGFEGFEERRQRNLDVIRKALDGSGGAEGLKTL